MSRLFDSIKLLVLNKFQNSSGLVRSINTIQHINALRQFEPETDLNKKRIDVM